MPCMKTTEGETRRKRRCRHTDGYWPAIHNACLDDLVVAVERYIATQHVVEQDTKRPDGCWFGVVLAITDPLWWTVDPRPCHRTVQHHHHKTTTGSSLQLQRTVWRGNSIRNSESPASTILSRSLTLYCVRFCRVHNHMNSS